jgi:hypothetical protein
MRGKIMGGNWARRRRLAVVLVVASLGIACLGLGAAHAFSLTSCQITGGTDYTYTGAGMDPDNWGEAQNWNPSTGTPKGDDTATIDGRWTINQGTPTQVCNLTLEGGSTLATGQTLTVGGDFTWDGSDPRNPGYLQGSVTVLGSADLTGTLHYSSNGNGAGDTLDAKGDLTVASSTNLELNDGADATLQVDGTATIGHATIWSNNASEDDDSSRLLVNGHVALSGDLSTEPNLDVNLHSNGTTTGSLDLAGHDLTIGGTSFSRWDGGAEVGSSGGSSGTVHLEHQGVLQLNGTTTLGTNAYLSLDGDAGQADPTLADGTYFGPSKGASGALTGQGGLLWQQGSLTGSITLTSGFRTALNRGGVRTISSSGTLINDGDMLLQDGTLEHDTSPGHIENDGEFLVCPGATLSRTTSSGVSLTNSPGATFGILPNNSTPGASPACPLADKATSVTDDGFSFSNSGALVIAKGQTLLATNGHESTLADGGTLTGGGVLEVADDDLLTVIGTTTMSEGTAVALKSTGGTAPVLDGGVIVGGTRYTGTLLGDSSHQGGSLQWSDGEVAGSLSTAGAINTSVVAGNANGHVLDTGTFPATALTVGGTASIDSTSISVSPHSSIDVAGTATITGSQSGVSENTSTSSPLTVDQGGSLTVSGASTTGLIDVPLDVLGTLAVDTGGLDAQLGYTQAGNGTTKLLNNGSVSVEDRQGRPGTIAMQGGSLLGSGTINAAVNATGGIIAPSLDGATPGKLTVNGDVSIAPAATLRAVLTGTAAAQHDQLAVNGAVSLAGHVEADTQGGFTPAAGTTVRSVLTGNSFTAFSPTVTSVGVPAHTSWDAEPDGNALDLQYNVHPVTTGVSASATQTIAARSPLPVSINVTPIDATGPVQILEGSAVRASGTLGAGGALTLNVPGLSAGRHTFTAHYLGDSTHLPSVSQPFAVTATPPGVSAGATGVPATTGVPTATTRVSPAAIARRVAAALRLRGRGARVSAILRRGGYVTHFNAPTAGTLTIRWYTNVLGAGDARTHKTVVATARIAIGRPGTRTVRIKLTARGRRLLRRSRRLSLTAQGTVSRAGTSPVIIRRAFRLSYLPGPPPRRRHRASESIAEPFRPSWLSALRVRSIR